MQLIDFMVSRRKLLLKYINNIVRNIDDAEDIYQDALASVLRHPPKDLDKKDFQPYAFQVVKANVHSWQQAQKMDSDGEVEEDAEKVELTFSQLHESTLDTCRDPLNRLMDEESLSRIPELIDRVPNEKHRELLNLLYVEGVSLKTAAHLCGMSYVNARVVNSRFMG